MLGDFDGRGCLRKVLARLHARLQGGPGLGLVLGNFQGPMHGKSGTFASAVSMPNHLLCLIGSLFGVFPGGAIRTLTPPPPFFFYYGIHSLIFGGYQTLRYLSW